MSKFMLNGCDKNRPHAAELLLPSLSTPNLSRKAQPTTRIKQSQHHLEHSPMTSAPPNTPAAAGSPRQNRSTAQSHSISRSLSSSQAPHVTAPPNTPVTASSPGKNCSIVRSHFASKRRSVINSAPPNTPVGEFLPRRTRSTSRSLFISRSRPLVEPSTTQHTTNSYPASAEAPTDHPLSSFRLWMPTIPRTHLKPHLTPLVIIREASGWRKEKPIGGP